MSEEIHLLLLVKISKEELDEQLECLLGEGKIFKYKKYFMLDNDKSMVQKRIEGELCANKVIPKAKGVGTFLSYFPFVRFVGISGSLSKGYADENSDFDFFIVTAKNRLWVCRTLLHLFKKATFIFNKQKYFCMNYFVDETAMHIADNNIYAMYEITSLIPVYNAEVYNRFISQNKWVSARLPQFIPKQHNVKSHNNILKSVVEFGLHILPLSSLNQVLMKLTDNKWKKKWNKANYPMEEYDLAFRTRINISKNHPKNHQKSVLNKLSHFL